ncbi:hypothetical protein Plec18167_006108 [Paecilomyces lecythidis]|uniref:Alpha/beta hydrolase fold-3 domain-containing protein n=1 Tax=Paecilomyces lecythidis TaxID=3004212 RepID=A0ABR3XDX9_9EURO
MIDHLLGRPSAQLRRLQILAIASLSLAYLVKGNKHGPPGIRKYSAQLAGAVTPWQTLFLTIISIYISNNFSRIFGLSGPEHLANMYSPSFFRATWILTALDAGFWTAMDIKPAFLRHIASLVFSAYYLFAVDQADAKVRKIHSVLTVDHVRVSWNKGKTPILAALGPLTRPKYTKYGPRPINIARPKGSAYTEPVTAWLYFDGSLEELRNQKKVVLDIPGGGFVAMDPRTVDDKLLSWAGKLGVPVISLDYKKAPEYPYPYAINECYDVYHQLATTRGQCIGLSGDIRPQIVVTGDSAGGNLASALTLLILQSGDNGKEQLPTPDGLLLVYPALSGNAGTWVGSEQMALIQDRSNVKTDESIIQLKKKFYEKMASSRTPVTGTVSKDTKGPSEQDSTTHIHVSSMAAYCNDRILVPDMARRMAMLYVGPNGNEDFSTDFIITPILAPESLLARFPKTYIITGEKDPLVDDTVIFAGRLREAKSRAFSERKAEYNEKDHLEVSIVPGVSHGFLQFAAVYSEAPKFFDICSTWVQALFDKADAESTGDSSAISLRSLDSE